MSRAPFTVRRALRRPGRTATAQHPKWPRALLSMHCFCLLVVSRRVWVRVGVDRLAGVADYSQKKLHAVLDEAGVDRSRITRKEQLVEKVRSRPSPLRYLNARKRVLPR